MADQSGSNILLSDKVPFLVSMLIAATGWSITHFVDRIENSPTIEYKVNSQKIDTDKTKFTVELHNLSLNKSFEGSIFLLRKLDPKDKSFNFLEGPESHVMPHAPAWVGQELSADVGPEAAQFKIKLFPPEGRVDLIAYCKGACEPVAFQGRPAEGTVMRLTERTFETFLVRHELASLLALAVLIIAAVSLVQLLFGRGQFGGDAKEVKKDEGC